MPLLRTFGGLSIEPEAGDGLTLSLGPRRLALLAVVAAAGPRGITREKLVGILWPDADEEQARHTLSQTLYLLRRETSTEWIAGTSQLRLHDSIKSDVSEFQDAVNRDQLTRAASVYAGPFLEGFYLAGAPAFEQWVEEARSRLQFMMRKALEMLASRAVDAGAFSEAITWWQRLGEIDPFSATYAVGQIRARIATGDQAGALRFAGEYESRIRRELEAEPDPMIGELIATLRATLVPRPAANGVGTLAVPVEAASALSPPIVNDIAVSSRRRKYWLPAAIGTLLVSSVVAWSVGRSNSSPSPPFLAIASIQSRDSAALGSVLRDMLATNLARIDGIQVVANSRLLELLPRMAGNTAAATADAARRAGANEMVEGELGVTAGGLVLTLRRVAMQSGLVRGGYSVRAADLYALTDSATAAIARDLRLDAPPDPVATVRTSSAIAYALYEEGLRAMYGGDAPAGLRLMNAALERDSTFAMAAYFAWLSSRITQRGDDEARFLALVRRLATRTIDRERLLIESLLAREHAPVSEHLAISRELTTRFPQDPDGHIAFGYALASAGDWPAAVSAFNRAVAIDSVSGAVSGWYCRVCQAIHGITNAYAWLDSAASAERNARRLLAFRPGEGNGWGELVEPLLRQGRRADAEAAVARAAKLSPHNVNFQPLLDRDLIRAGRSDELEARLVAELRSASPHERGEAPWLLVFSLRNQGRLRDAQNLAEHGMLPGTDRRLAGHKDPLSLAVIAFERGQPREAARRFLEAVAADHATADPTGFKSRMVSWHMTLAATALAAAGDTAAVRALADSVQRVGASSSFGRDHKLHHYLRGLLLQHEGRHAEAVEAFRRALFSPTEGYTRTNLEMARSLMALRHYPEAIAALQPALRGGIDGSNTYVTHTELREVLAQAFERAGQPDSARVHYAAVERAWRRADPQFADRYRVAKSKAALLQPHD